MIRGSCACGAVRFEIDKVRALTTCHCSICRKLSGSAFGTYAHVDADKFRFLAGEDMLAEYESTPGSIRKRCKVCGCSAPARRPICRPSAFRPGCSTTIPPFAPCCMSSPRRVRHGGRSTTIFRNMRNGSRAMNRRNPERWTIKGGNQ
jgi:hypothetical protein